MSRRAVVWAVMCVSAAALGSSAFAATTVPKAKIISEGDAICTQFGKSALPIAAKLAASLKTPVANLLPKLMAGTPAGLKAAAPTLAKLATLQNTEVKQLEALGTPNQDVAVFKQVIADEMKSAAYTRAAVQAAARGDESAFIAAVGPKGADSLTPHGQKFGFRVCDIPSSS